MLRKKLSSAQQTILITFILLFGSFIIFSVASLIRENDDSERKAQLEYVHKRSIDQFSNSIDNLATLVSGLRSYLKYTDPFPDELALKNFVYSQLEDLNFQDSIIISYIDTTGVFQYVFTRSTTDPAKLVGQSVYDIRENPKRRDRVGDLSNERLLISKPINLVEGWVGIPINFNIIRDGRSLGYLSTILDFKSIVGGLYDSATTEQFVFKFATKDSVEFDRERVYDGEQVFNAGNDPEYWSNFNLSQEDFISSEVELYGFSFIMSTAYKTESESTGWWSFFIYGWYILLLSFLALIFFQGYRYRMLNQDLKESNRIIRKQKDQADKQNEELANLNATKNRFFHIIAHDLKNPFSAIHSIIGIIKDQNLSQEESMGMIGNLSEVTQRTQNLLENLLKWAQVQTGELEHDFSILILSQLIEEAVIDMQPLADSKQIKINCDLEKDLVINADYAMFSTVVKNLISNGIKYCNPGEGKIDIQTWANETSIHIKVSDNGVGISEKEKEILFNLDRGASFQGTLGEKGTGLGLALSKEYLRLHQGSIDVSSEKGKGAIFLVTIPKASLS